MKRKGKAKPKRPNRAAGLTCPHCGAPRSEVTRTTSRGTWLQRHRRCSGCGKDFHTRETIIATDANALARISVESVLRLAGLSPAELSVPVTLPNGGKGQAE